MRKMIKITVSLILVLFLFSFSVTAFTTDMPITGTFLIADTPASDSILSQIYSEMQQTGIDTVIFLAAGGWWPLPCSSNPPTFNEQYYFTPNSWYLNSLKQVKNQGMKIFFGLVNTDIWGCTPFWQEPYRTKILDYAERLIDQLKVTVATEGWSWDDQQFAGFYVPEQGISAFTNTTSADTQFWKELVSRIKAKAPNKKVLMSPWVLESYDYGLAKTAYANLYSLVGVDILAPQDSMGTLKVTSYTKSSELFRALRDAAQQTGKTAWANIETFTQDSPSSSTYYPSDINKISQQIAAATPYVSKMITWIYQHTMLSVPALDNFPSWMGQYTPANAQKRKQLRNDYMAYYNFPSVCQSKYYYHLGNKQCQQTTALYHNTTLKQCGVLDAPSCSENLSRYLPGQTTGICYLSLNECQQANSTPTPTPTPSPTPIPTSIPTPSPSPTPTPSPSPTLTPTPSSIPSPTPSPTPSSTPTSNPADLTDEGDTPGDEVNIFDYNQLVSDFGKTGSPGWLRADIDKNGKVDIFDYNILVENFGK